MTLSFAEPGTSTLDVERIREDFPILRETVKAFPGFINARLR